MGCILIDVTPQEFSIIGAKDVSGRIHIQASPVCALDISGSAIWLADQRGRDFRTSDGRLIILLKK